MPQLLEALPPDPQQELCPPAPLLGRPLSPPSTIFWIGNWPLFYVINSTWNLMCPVGGFRLRDCVSPAHVDVFNAPLAVRYWHDAIVGHMWHDNVQATTRTGILLLGLAGERSSKILSIWSCQLLYWKRLCWHWLYAHMPAIPNTSYNTGNYP